MVVRLIKEQYFLNYNRDNIFINLNQSEDHFKNLKTSDTEKGHLNCVVKHLAIAEGEANEAISHALVAEGLEQSQNYERLRDGIRQFRRKLQDSQVGMEEGILAVRDLRNQLAEHNPEYDVSKCRACGDMEGFKGVLDEKGLYSKTEHYSSEPTMRKADTKLLTKVVAPIYAGELVGEAGTIGVDYLASMYPSTPLGQYLGATIDALIAIALTYGVMITKSEAGQLIEAAIGGYFVADGVQKLSQPYVPVAARTFYVAPTGMGQALVTASPAIGKYTY